MPFGIDAGLSRNTSNSVQVANKELEEGAIEEMTTFGGVETVTEEDYTGASFANEALNGQVGNTTTGVVTQHDNAEVNNDYAKSTKTTQKPLAAGA